MTHSLAQMLSVIHFFALLDLSKVMILTAFMFVSGHFLFTELLVPSLAAGAKSSPDGYSRIVTTSSNGAYGGRIDYSTFRDGPPRRKAGNVQMYFNSKLVSGRSHSFTYAYG